MRTKLILCLSFLVLQLTMAESAPHLAHYRVGVNDILKINVLQPDELSHTVTVAPDGAIVFPYIGRIDVDGLTLDVIQSHVEKRLGDGYMKFPVVSVSLIESRSKTFHVYGEVKAPGSYPINGRVTVLKAVSMAGGFTKFGSSSDIKVLRPKKREGGYEQIRINLKKVMNGENADDIALEAGDIVVVSE